MRSNKIREYYRAMSLIKSAGKVLFYQGSTNVDENLVRFKNDRADRRNFLV